METSKSVTRFIRGNGEGNRTQEDRLRLRFPE